MTDDHPRDPRRQASRREWIAIGLALAFLFGLGAALGVAVKHLGWWR